MNTLHGWCFETLDNCPGKYSWLFVNQFVLVQ